MRVSFAISGAVALTFSVASSAVSQPTAGQKCSAAKMVATGRYSLCRLVAEAKAEKTGEPVDFSKCGQKHTKAFQKFEDKSGVDCPTIGDAIDVQISTAADASALACRLKLVSDGTPPPTYPIVVVPNITVTETSDPILRLTNSTMNPVPFYCFYASADAPTCQTRDFNVTVPPQSSVSWFASMGRLSDFIPPTTVPFSGEMVCVEATNTFVPLYETDLAASVTPAGGCTQNGFGIARGDSNDADMTLELGGGPWEYGPCPASIGAARIESCWSLSALTWVCH